mgnify:CR=1 FL=1
MNQIEISTQPVELFKILKFEGLVASGGEAKTVIDEELVKVNGAIETRRRKKMMDGDTLEFQGEIYQLVLKP